MMPLGPLLASAFRCSIEEQLQDQGKMLDFHKRYAMFKWLLWQQYSASKTPLKLSFSKITKN